MKTKLSYLKEAFSGRMQKIAHRIAAILFIMVCMVMNSPAQDVPGILWIRQYGTISADASGGINAEGNIYEAGYTFGAFPGYTNFLSYDGYVVKYDPAGNQLWLRQFGLSSFGQQVWAYGIAADGSGVYITGNATHALPGQTGFGLSDAFVKKFDHDGTELWTRQFGTSAVDQVAYGIVVDAEGVYVIGTTQGAFPGFTNAGGKDFFIAKYSPDGTQLLLVQAGTAGDDYCTGIFADASGNYISGYENSSGQNDAFISKYSLEGNLVWTTGFGTSEADMAHEISGDGTGLYVSGQTSGTFPDQSYAGGPTDAFAVKFDFNGNQLWMREFGTDTTDFAYGISASTSGVYITGNTEGAFPGQTNTGGSDIFVAKYNKIGNPAWVFQIGSAQSPGSSTVPTDYGFAISVASSNAYISGYVNGTLPGTTRIGGSDAYLMKLLVNLPPVAGCGDDQVRIITETVKLDGSSSSDQDGDAITYDWSFVSLPAGSGAVISNATSVNPAFTADVTGDYVVQLIANDGTEDSDPCLVTITVVQTPQEATQYLIVDVQELVTSGVLNEGQGNALIVKLETAIEKMNQGNYNAAINNLSAFINQVNAYSNAGILSDEEASALIVAAERIIDYLENLLAKGSEVFGSGDPSMEENFQAWNYPNPFNFSTTIRYTLPHYEFVIIKVYNSLGDEMSVLVNSYQGAGEHLVAFNAAGQQAGIYYYHIQAGSFSTAGKLIVLR